MEKLETLDIIQVNYTDKKKDETPILNKFGKPSYKTGIKTKQYGEEWLNGLLPFPPDKWKDTQQTVLVYDDEKWGKQFKLPPKNGFGGLSEADKAQIVFANRTANAAMAEVKRIRGELELLGVLPTVASGGETADFSRRDEDESLEASAEAAMR